MEEQEDMLISIPPWSDWKKLDSANQEAFIKFQFHHGPIGSTVET